MKHAKKVVAVTLIAAISLGCTCIFAAEENAEKAKNTRGNHRFASSVSEETVAERKEAFAATLAEKLEAGEITQEQYDKIVTVMESGTWSGMGGRMNGKAPFAEKRAEITDEQKAEMAERVTATLEEKLEAGEITQEQYDKIVAAKESGKFGGINGRRNWKDTDNSEAADNNEAEATDEETSGRPQNAFGKFRGMGGKMNGRANGRNWNQNVEESAE